MARDFQINGEALVEVLGATGTAVSSIQELGLAEGPIQVTLNGRHADILVDAWGGAVPADVQWMLADAFITMNLIHFDREILEECLRLAWGGGGGTTSTDGVLARAGVRLGAPVGGPAAARFAAGWKYVSLNISAPQSSSYPWNFRNSYIHGSPAYPLGTEKSVVQLQWRCVPYTRDPYGDTTQGGSTGGGAGGHILFNRNRGD